ncbi:MAG: hypothetical protein JKY92_05455 [Magnetovibrio sp.]|nr:hypothetical protein [Magnetovibrio sp.]
MATDPCALVILDHMPLAAEFFEVYWNQKPFLVRNAIGKADFEPLISAEELAGLSLEDAPQSRLMKTPQRGQEGGQKGGEGWSCEFGPFSQQDFTACEDHNWSLLVQNVEQFHPDTATLLRHFDFSPRWLMDDIMVSYSEPGGSVGPHIDNYHVFLVQGQGRRQWTVGRAPIVQEQYIEDLDFKILKEPIEGDAVEVGQGDVLYLPPRFGHQGTTIERSMTFSVGFLGPKVSELMSGYGQYLADNEAQDQRYVGAGLGTQSSGFKIDQKAVERLRDCLAQRLESPDFSKWLVAFFTESSHDNFGNLEDRDDAINVETLGQTLADGARLIKPQYVKFAITAASPGQFNVGFDAHSFILQEPLFPLLQAFMKERSVGIERIQTAQALKLVVNLFNHHALEFED